MDYKYSAVADWIRQRIEAGEYKPGRKLPSVQGLAEKMSCNADTVVKAYRQLEAEHLVYAVPKSGFYVLKNKPAVKACGLLVSGVDDCYIPGFEHASGLRLCVCNASDEELREAVAMIEQELSIFKQKRGE